MSNDAVQESLLSEIAKIPDDQVKAPTLPVKYYAQEAEELYFWARHDREKLQAAKLDWDLVETLPARIDVFRATEGVWFVKRFNRPEAREQWLQIQDGAYAFRDDLLAACRYAYRNMPDLLRRVTQIAEGTGQADLIQDLINIAILGKDNTGPLEAIGFDLAKLDESAVKAKEWSKLLAAAATDAVNDPLKRMRDRAFTYLATAVAEIRACGLYVFRKDPKRLKGYRSDYARRTGSAGTGETTESAGPASVAQA